MVHRDDVGFKDGGCQKEEGEKGGEIAVRHKEDTLPPPGSVIQGEEKSVTS